MKNGKYEVKKEIHCFSCEDGQLKIGKGTQIVVNGNTAMATNTVRFPARMLDGFEDSLMKLKRK